LASSSLAGAAAAVGAAAFYGLAFTYARRNLAGIQPMTASAGQLTMGALLLSPFAIFTSVQHHGIHLTTTRVIAIALLGIVGTGLAYPLYYQAIASEGATRASVVTYLVPVVAVAVGVGLLHEEFRFRLVAGAALTLFGIALLHERVGRTRVVPVNL
jgi:drug/metabolite transporter (DMT)-like permease